MLTPESDMHRTVIEKLNVALADVAQWVERRPANQSVTGSIPSQGTCMGCEPGRQLGAC